MNFGERAAELAGAASLLLGWRAREFWESTPAELATALGQGPASEQISRDEIERLQTLFPDN